MKKYLPVITKQYSRKVEIKDIIYIEQHQRRLVIVTDDETFVYYESMDDIMHYLDKEFYRVMKKLTVNMDRIVLIKEQCLLFDSGQCLYLGKENYIKAKQRFTSYLRHPVKKVEVVDNR